MSWLIFFQMLFFFLLKIFWERDWILELTLGCHAWFSTHNFIIIFTMTQEREFFSCTPYSFGVIVREQTSLSYQLAWHSPLRLLYHRECGLSHLCQLFSLPGFRNDVLSVIFVWSWFLQILRAHSLLTQQEHSGETACLKKPWKQ